MTAPNPQYTNLLCTHGDSRNSCAANPQVANADPIQPCNPDSPLFTRPAD